MYESCDIISDFNNHLPSFQLNSKLSNRLFITGEGSSRMIPAKNIIQKNLSSGCPLNIFTEGANQAKEYNLHDFNIIGISNSGQTKELIGLFSELKAKGHKHLHGITANQNTMLESLSNHSHILSCGKEKAVAATKSVIEQSLVIESLFNKAIGNEYPDLGPLAKAFKQTLDISIDEAIISKLVNAPCLYFAGRNNGIAEELTLKTNEITRKKSDYLEGTYGVHGIEEVMHKDEAVILLDPFPEEEAKYKEVFIDNIGMTVISISSKESIFKTIKIPQLPGFDNYLQLAAGWNLLVEIALQSGVNPDKPVRARKVGNAYNNENTD